MVHENLTRIMKYESWVDKSNLAKIYHRIKSWKHTVLRIILWR